MDTDHKTENIIPWARLIAFGIGELKLSPIAFWALTLREISAVMAGCYPQVTQDNAPLRSHLEQLMKDNPDIVNEPASPAYSDHWKET